MRLLVLHYECDFRQDIPRIQAGTHIPPLLRIVRYQDQLKTDFTAAKVWQENEENFPDKLTCWSILPKLSIPSWLWIWAGIIVIIKIVNQISSLIIIKKFCFPHTIANKLTGFLLFLTVPTISWCIIPIAIAAIIATFAALQEWHSIRNKIDIV